MKGKFMCPFTVIIYLVYLAAICIPSYMFAEAQYYTAAISLITLLALMYALWHIPGRYSADDDSITFKILFLTYRFEYKDIQTVETQNRQMKTRWEHNNKVFIETELTIFTADRVYRFRSAGFEYFPMNSILNDSSRSNRTINMTDNLEFVRLGKFIESKIKEHN